MKIVAAIPLLFVRGAIKACAAGKVHRRFSIYRLRSNFDWIPERRELALAKDR